MSFRHYRYADLKATPWKNGGGTTREILRTPETSTLDDFDVRCSIADVTVSGPFSSFPGHHRTIVQLSGTPMKLQSPTFTEPQILTPFEPFHFDGAVAIDCEVASPTVDYNFMIRKASNKSTNRNFASVKGINVTLQLSPKSMVIYFVMHGEAAIDFVDGNSSGALTAFDTIVIENQLATKLPFTLRLIGRANVIGHTISP